MLRHALPAVVLSLCACSLALEGAYEAPVDAGGRGPALPPAGDAGVGGAPDGGVVQDAAGAPTPATDASTVTHPADTCAGAVHETEPNDSEAQANDVTGVFCGVTSLTDMDYLRLVVPQDKQFQVQLEAPRDVYYALTTSSSAASGNGATTTSGTADDNGAILELWATTATPLAYRVTLTTK
jgi:hypothetical protein